MSPLEHECSMNRPHFFRKAYHNLRNPIAVIKGYTSLMLEGCGGELSPDQAEWVQDMKNNEEFLLQLINNLAELSFIEGRVGEKERTEVDTAAVLESLMKKHSQKAGQKGLALKIEAPEVPLNIAADEALISRAFDNLIHNALAYTPEGGAIHLTLREDDRGIIFSVADSGAGLEEAQIAQILEGFFKGEDPSGDDYRGTGLGILISRRIAELYGGALQVESSPGRGSTFTLTLRP